MKIEVSKGSPVLLVMGCIFTIFLCGSILTWGLVGGVGAITFFIVSQETSAFKSEVEQIIQEDPELVEVFGSPIKIKNLNSSYSFSSQGDTRTGTMEAPVKGPLDSGRLFADIKQIGEEVRVTGLRVESDSGRTIRVISE